MALKLVHELWRRVSTYGGHPSPWLVLFVFGMDWFEWPKNSARQLACIVSSLSNQLWTSQGALPCFSEQPCVLNGCLVEQRDDTPKSCSSFWACPWMCRSFIFLAVSHTILRKLLPAVSSNFLSRRTTTKFAPHLSAPTFCCIIGSFQAIITTKSSRWVICALEHPSTLSTFGLVPDDFVVWDGRWRSSASFVGQSQIGRLSFLPPRLFTHWHTERFRHDFIHPETPLLEPILNFWTRWAWLRKCFWVLVTT